MKLRVGSCLSTSHSSVLGKTLWDQFIWKGQASVNSMKWKWNGYCQKSVNKLNLLDLPHLFRSYLSFYIFFKQFSRTKHFIFFV